MFACALIGLVGASTFTFNENGTVSVPNSLPSGIASHPNLHLGAAGTVDTSTEDGALKGRVCGVWACYATETVLCQHLKIKWEKDCEEKMHMARKKSELDKTILATKLNTPIGGAGGVTVLGNPSTSSGTNGAGGTGPSNGGSSDGSDTGPSNGGSSNGNGAGLSNGGSSNGSGTGSSNGGTSAGTRGSGGTGLNENGTDDSAESEKNLRGNAEDAAASGDDTGAHHEDGDEALAFPFLLLSLGAFLAMVCCFACFLVTQRKKKPRRSEDEGWMQPSLRLSSSTNKPCGSRSGAKSTRSRSTGKSRTTNTSTRRRSSRRK